MPVALSTDSEAKSGRAGSIVTAAVTVAIPKKPPDFHKHPGAELEGGVPEKNLGLLRAYN